MRILIVNKNALMEILWDLFKFHKSFIKNNKIMFLLKITAFEI